MRFRPPPSGPVRQKLDLRVAPGLGMDREARQALHELLRLAQKGRVAVAGMFMPDRQVSAGLAARGVVEGVDEADFFRFDRIVTPYHGISSRQRRAWEEKGIRLTDLASSLVKRAQAALGLLRMEGSRPLVIGRHEDAETRSISDGQSAATVIEDTTDTARLAFSPVFGAVCQTTLSPRRVEWLVQQLRHRYRDAKVTFLDTRSPAMAEREQGLEAVSSGCDQVLLVGQAGESTCEALAEAANRLGKPAFIVSGPEELEALDLGGVRRIALSAGGFAADESVRNVVAALVRR
jgi:4-hydroxy-3-methylbut-2-en-1-yl diphosphate reductase